jgi:uncharacterized protein
MTQMKLRVYVQGVESTERVFSPLSVLSVCSVVFFSFLTGSLYSDDPWGKDADLAKSGTQACNTQASAPACNFCQTPLLGAFGEVMIKFHQEIISPCDGPRSHFKPSSSQYTLNAMRKYGFYIGMTMGCDRLMRENKDEWIYRYTVDGAGIPIKYDPVP